MKIFLIIISIFAENALASEYPFAKIQTFDWPDKTIFKNSKTEEEIHSMKVSVKEDHSKKIAAEAQYLILNGNTEAAMEKLNSIEDQFIKDKVIIDPYKLYFQGLIHFIEGRYIQADKSLSDPIFSSPQWFPQICLIHILNKLILKKTDKLDKVLNRCNFENANFDSESEIWLNALVNLKNKNESTLDGNFLLNTDSFFETYRGTILWLKLVIYLNKETAMQEYLLKIPQDHYQYEKVRELIGIVYYRVGDIVRANKFIEDLTSANIENIKGNLKVKEQKYELAYGHYSLALKKKQNSKNAIERALPLSWKLRKFQDGINLIHQISSEKEYKIQKQVIKSAFLTQIEKFYLALSDLIEIEEFFGNAPPLEVTQLLAYNSLRTNDLKRFKYHSLQSCKHADGIGCTMLISSSIWEDLTRTILRNDELYRPVIFKSLLEKNQIVEIDEKLVIDQRYIEELDDKERFIPLE